MDPADGKKPASQSSQEEPAQTPAPSDPEAGSSSVSIEPTTDNSDTYTYYDDYGYDNYHSTQADAAPDTALATTQPASAPAPPPPPAPPPVNDEDDPEEDGMLRMSFLEHLEELRSRILKALMGLGIAFFVSLYFVNDLWAVITEPAMNALRENGIKDPRLAMLKPTEAFSIIWVKLPIVAALFLASPWLVYQVWGFIAPGLYKRERKWAVPFILCTAGLFICGGLFAYFIAFPLGLGFLLGIGIGQNVNPVVSITDYFDLWVNVTLGLGLVFELPVLIFFLSLLRILTPGFLMRNARYAILLIVVVAAIITPTPDVINLVLISAPMTVLYFAGVFASYLLWLSRENKRFPWMLTIFILLSVLATLGGMTYLATAKLGYKFILSWPFLVR
jgi:sec-independent protein translocase protein TatC